MLMAPGQATSSFGGESGSWTAQPQTGWLIRISIRQVVCDGQRQQLHSVTFVRKCVVVNEGKNGNRKRKRKEVGEADGWLYCVNF